MKKKVVKKILLFLIIALIIFSIYNFAKFFTSGKQVIGITTASSFCTDSNLEAIVSVKDTKNNISKKSNVKIELLNKDGKKVKDLIQKQKIEEGENANFSIPLPDDIETGNYELKVTAESGILKDSTSVNISIINKINSNVTISLDKGIYKPGDEINFRALVTAKKDDKPVEEDISISIYDGNDNRVFLEETKTSEFGIVSGKFILADEVNSGEYKIKVETKSIEKTKTFTVNPYITPKFETKIATDKENYMIGETAKITINAKYFFGENVKNASVEGYINEEDFSGLTDEHGNYTIDYKVEKSGLITLAANVIDSSNYLVEAEKNIYGCNDIFEIELLPVNGNIIRNIDNDIYVITQKIDGTPVKTYATLNIGKINKQVITDENGVGKITLTSNDIDSLIEIEEKNNLYSKEIKIDIKIIAEDMNKNKVEKSCPVIISKPSSVVLETDKLKYNQGDDINLKLTSVTDLNNEEKIYVYKNNELLKMISTDQEEISFNLEDAYGLIDIYLQNAYNVKYYKRTIFIKPNQKLNIDIETDSEEYKPGDNLNIKFETTNESNDSVESALMISILDEAILNLAENDLSIDKIKLALEDIKLADGMTAADIYASIMNDTQEHKLMTVLLKQDFKNPNIINRTNLNTKERDENLQYAILSGIVAITIILIIASVKSKRFANGVIHIINIIAVFVLLNACLFELLNYDFDISEGITILINSVMAIVLYILILYKKKDILFKTILELLVIPGIVFLLLGFIYEATNELIAVLILLLPVVILTILTLISRKYPLKKRMELLKNIVANLTKIEIVHILIILSVTFLDIDNLPIVCIIAVIIYSIVEKIYKKNKKVKDRKNNITSMETLGSVVKIEGIILIILVGILIYNNISTPQIMNSAEPSISTGEYIISNSSFKTDGSSINSSFDWANTDSTVKDTILDSDAIFSTFSADIKSEKEQTTTDTSEKEEIQGTEKQEDTEENIRNVFLESLAFIPELITKNGIAETNIKISDNITTWNIQTAGNTKEGNIGFNTSKIKVFKEFFIDFSLPTNSVVSDKTSIPVTVYNYKDTELDVSLNVKENEWCNIGEYTKQVKVPAGQTKLIYVPIEILKDGENTLRIESRAGDIEDIVEKTFKVTPKGFEKSKLVGTGTIEKDYSQDYFTTEEAIENTRKLKIKIYPSLMSQAVEGMDNIFRMPTGCFEQTSASLYPNVLALKYLENTGEVNSEIKEKALDYISKGYQRILTFEVQGEKGGYSLYGDSPAEPVITAFGLMELTDLSEVYEVEEQVIEDMKNYLFKVQKVNGSFEYNSTYIGGTSSKDDLAMNAYIIWALSETCPEDARLKKSIEYLENKVDDITDNYTRALIANIFINTKNELADKLIDQLLEQVNVNGEKASISSRIKDYYGSYGRYQDIQTAALTSMALTKDKSNTKTNSALINSIIERKDTYGTWGTTQATVLALKAINDFNVKSNLANQTISIKVNDEVKEIKFKDNLLDLYELTFNNIEKENKISIEMKEGKLYYEIIEEYYVPYENVEESENILVSQAMVNSNIKVNNILEQNIKFQNISDDTIRNGLLQINIPQGCSVIEETLSKLVHEGIIEKYEYSYGKINLYLRNIDAEKNVDLKVEYRAMYPENITGGAIRVYDYYNPNIEGFAMPVNISVSQ